jgi:hypothetical protein
MFLSSSLISSSNVSLPLNAELISSVMPRRSPFPAQLFENRAQRFCDRLSKAVSALPFYVFEFVPYLFRQDFIAAKRRIDFFRSAAPFAFPRAAV